jgi:cytoskeletal protein RodZ
MKPIGHILQTARKEKGWTVSDVSKHTRIRTKYLELIELNEFDSLPGIAYTRGFIKSYAEAVGLVPERVMSLFRREFTDDEKKQKVIPESFVDMPAKRVGFWLTIKDFLSKLFS